MPSCKIARMRCFTAAAAYTSSLCGTNFPVTSMGRGNSWGEILLSEAQLWFSAHAQCCSRKYLFFDEVCRGEFEFVEKHIVAVVTG